MAKIYGYKRSREIYKEYIRQRNKIRAMTHKLQRDLEKNSRDKQSKIQSNSGTK